MSRLAREATQDLVGSRCVILAPHPDDEVLGCGGTIAAGVRQGAEVFIVFLTDGRRGLVDPSTGSPDVRRGEAVQAAAILGMLADRLTFLQFEDGALGEYVVQATEHVQRLVDKWSIDTIFLPYRRDYHRDHLAAWRIGLACRRRGMRMYEYPIWYGPWLWNRLGWPARLAAVSQLVDARRAVKLNIASVVDLKHQALRAYRSRLQAFEREAWGPAFLRHFLGDDELFFVSR